MGVPMKPERHTAGLGRTPHEFVVSESLDIEGWDDFVSQHEVGHHVQSTAWARFQRLRGWTPVRIFARSGDSLIAVAQILTKRASVFGHVGYLDRAPLVDPGHLEVLPSMISAIQALVRERSVRILVSQPSSEDAASVMADGGFSRTDLIITLPATVRVDLTSDIDDVLAGMKSKTRYNVRKGLRSGLTVREGNRSDARLFHEMLDATAQRQHFESSSIEYVEGLCDALGTMFIAEDGTGPVSAVLLVAFGSVVVYKRGAWSGRAGKLHPNELLHWTAMQWAKERGYDKYDFDGIEPEIGCLVLEGRPIPPDAVRGVTRFKLGFGGDVVMLPSALIYIPNRFLRFGHDSVFRRLSGTKLSKRVVKWIQTR